jgi:hypothetical protein
MAGFILYSLDWDKFNALIQKPTPDQLSVLAKSIASQREEMDGQFDDDDPVAEWPEDRKSLAPIIAVRLALPDWYSDLSEAGRQLWETAFYVACMRSKKIDLDFRVDSDGVYWDVVSLIVEQLGDQPERPGKSAMSRFGTVPFRFHPTASDESSDWTPMHSMHPPEEVKQMLTEIQSVAATVEASDEDDIRKQFTDELLPALEQVAADGRMLFIQVDT